MTPLVREAKKAYAGFVQAERLLPPCREAAVDYLPSLDEIEHAARCVLAALFLSGAPRAFELRRAQAPEISQAVRAEGARLKNVGRMLRRRGFIEAALALESPGLLAWAEDQVRAGRALTAAHPEYPLAWARKLGPSAPPALWRKGRMPTGPFLAIVGSRWIPPEVRAFAHETGKEGVSLGLSIVSGGAAGCDRAAAGGAAESGKSFQVPNLNPKSDIRNRAAPLVEILPCGINVRRERFGGCVLSPFAPNEDFSGPNAMQRNALIYAMAQAAVVVSARFGEGGTWRGAVEAHRRRLCRLIVRKDGSQAADALVALGATPLRDPTDLADALCADGIQAELWP